jgi:hypothetical protein
MSCWRSACLFFVFTAEAVRAGLPCNAEAKLKALIVTAVEYPLPTTDRVFRYEAEFFTQQLSLEADRSSALAQASVGKRLSQQHRRLVDNQLHTYLT